MALQTTDLRSFNQGSKEKGMKGQMDGQVEDFEDKSESMKK